MTALWKTLRLSAAAAALLSACAHLPAYEPLTPRLAQDLFAGAQDMGKVQVYYAAKRESASGGTLTRTTVFRHSEEQLDRSVRLDRRPVLEKEVTVVHDDLLLHHHTPGAIVAAERTAPGGYLMRVDFGGNVMLDFESRAPSERFYLKTSRIELGGKAYLREKDAYGYLVLDAERRTTTTFQKTARDIQGKLIE